MVTATVNVHDRIAASLAETNGPAGMSKLSFKAMGTLCHITMVATSPAAIQTFKSTALHWVADFEARYSRFLPDSLISRINAAAGKYWVEVDAASERMFDLCEQLVFFTNNAFDPTALPLIKLWNWKAEPPVIPTDYQIAAASELVGWEKVQRRPGAIFLLEPGMCLDLGGIGKEYAVDCVVELARQHGLANLLVDFGQDVRATGRPPERDAWLIGLEDPKQPGKCWAAVAVKDSAVATSGDYLRCFERDGRRYGHIIDPRTGRPVYNSCRSVTVIAPSCTVAGVLSTTAFELGAREGLNLIENYHGAEGCIITESSRFETRRFISHVIEQS
jgi:FAD:protein FMN transferase